MEALPEEWAEIEGFPGYAVSNYGVVRNIRTGLDLTPKVNSYGYHSVSLRRDGRTHYRYIHQLVAKTFVTGYVDGVYVKHHDENRGNNYVVNLRFAGGTRLGRLAKGVRNPTFRQVRIVETGEVFRSVRALAAYFNTDPNSIYKVLRGERISHRGYRYEFLEEAS